MFSLSKCKWEVKTLGKLFDVRELFMNGTTWWKAIENYAFILTRLKYGWFID